MTRPLEGSCISNFTPGRDAGHAPTFHAAGVA